MGLIASLLKIEEPGRQSDYRKDGESCSRHLDTPAVRNGLAFADVVEPNADEPCHQLQQGASLAVAGRARVGGDRLLRLGREPPVGADLEPQRRRKAFARRIARLAVDDHGDHPRGAAHGLEGADLPVDVFALRRVWRADHHQELGGRERRAGLLGERMASGEVVTVAKNRLERSRHRPDRGWAANQIAVDAEAFE
ncbi:MAG TPA: hypothetical protein VE909_06305, partial [Xanthobacteraceae bacterium]|nr:hypothetical protein [Xanthobacteraceae bacterium]